MRESFGNLKRNINSKTRRNPQEENIASATSGSGSASGSYTASRSTSPDNTSAGISTLSRSGSASDAYVSDVAPQQPKPFDSNVPARSLGSQTGGSSPLSAGSVFGRTN